MTKTRSLLSGMQVLVVLAILLWWHCGQGLFTFNTSLSAPSLLRNGGEMPIHEFSPADCRPNGIHLAQATDVVNGKLHATLSFLLSREHCSTDIRPVVIYGRRFRPEGSSNRDPPLQFNYTSHKTNGTFQSDLIYHIELTDLVAGQQQYWYEILILQRDEDGEEAVEGILRAQTHARTLTFRTPPLPGQPTALALVGDLGQTENSTKTMRHMWNAASGNGGSRDQTKLEPVTQLLIAGDMSYADSDPHRWISWLQLMEKPLLRHLLLHVAAGNHEIECDTQTLDVFTQYEAYFRMPNRLRPAELQPITDEYRKTLWNGDCSTPSVFQGHYYYGNSFYAYTHGLARIVVLNSYTQTYAGSPQYQFLERELKKANKQRATTPWLIVTFHSPLYTTFLGHVNELEAIRMRVAMEPLFLLYKVNLIVSGHDHAYMRTHPMYNGTVIPDGKHGPIYLTLGAGGNREHHSRGFRNKDSEPWVAKRDISDYGYGHLFLPNATHARFTWVRDDDGMRDGLGVKDSVWITNLCVVFPW